MSFSKGQVVFFFFVVLVQFASAQTTSLREKIIPTPKDTLRLDSLSIYPASFEVWCGNEKMSSLSYHLDYATSVFSLIDPCSDSIKLRYRVLPIDLSKSYYRRDTSLIYTEKKGDRELFMMENEVSVQDVFGGAGLTKSGSISRGVTFGNNQDLGVNSTLNLELSGDITPNLKLINCDGPTNGHGWKLFKPRRCHLPLAMTLSTRVVNDWNKLLADVVDATSEACFKKLIDHHLWCKRTRE